MRLAREIVILLALALLAYPTSGTATTSADNETAAQEERNNESKEDSRHKSCEATCLKDGEDPMECESYCIQVAGDFGSGCPM